MYANYSGFRAEAYLHVQQTLNKNIAQKSSDIRCIRELSLLSSHSIEGAPCNLNDDYALNRYTVVYIADMVSCPLYFIVNSSVGNEPRS
jgi:hypothetical protein